MNVISWSPGITLEAIEKMVILKAYEFFRRNKSATATSLGISVRTLDHKLEKYEMEAKQEEERQANELRKRTEFLARARGNPPNNIGVPYSPSSHQAGQFNATQSGVRMESIANSTSQQDVPLPERTEVQTMLSKQAPQSSKKGNR